MLVALVSRLTAPTSATTTFGKARLFLGLASKRTPAQAQSTEEVLVGYSSENDKTPSPPQATPAQPPSLAGTPCPQSPRLLSYPSVGTTPTISTTCLLARISANLVPETLAPMQILQTGAPPLAAGDEPDPPGPIVPTGPPYWPGDPDVVPEPAQLRHSKVCSSASFIGAQLWVAVTGTAAAQLHRTGTEREAYASRFRSQVWKAGFMDRHKDRFADNPHGARSQDQFQVGYLCVPEIRRLAHKELLGTAFEAAWFPWMAWLAGAPMAPPGGLAPPGSKPAGLDGYCYEDLAPYGVDRAAMRTSLGPWPTVGEIRAWFTDHDLPAPAVMKLVPSGPGRYHLTDRGGSCMRLDGGRQARLDSIPFDPDARVGGLDITAPADGSGAPPTGGGAVATVRWNLPGDLVTAMALTASPAIQKYTRTWESVTLVKVHARFVGNEPGSVLAVALGTPATRAGAAAAAADAELTQLLASEEYVVLDATAAGVGVAGADVPLPVGCDRELSARRAPSGGLRPDIRVNFSAVGHAQAVISITLAIGGTALTTTSSPTMA